MERKKKYLIRDCIFIVISIGVAFYLFESGAMHRFTLALAGYQWVGSFFAGVLFTSLFTTAPAIVVLGELATEQSVLQVALVGALGAMVGDLILFNLVRDRIAEDIAFMLSQVRVRRLRALFKTKLFHSLTPFIGALVIASPLPDELGLTLLGLSKISERTFLVISFVMNAVGIYTIGMIAVATLGS